ncbi:MAG TPA: mechanosensitive ion channel family protein [Thermodesulfobacteriota bacterium]|nr:mechanosensitive ion channel family protein [Thermodesulfobacteriota bacterium]
MEIKFYQLILFFGFLVGSFLLGVIFEKIILTQIKKIAEKTKWKGDEVIVHAIHKMPILWFFIAGIYGALHSIEIPPTFLGIIHKVLLISVIFSGTVVLARISLGFVTLYSEKVGGVFVSTSIFSNLIKLIVFLIGILIILQSLGISITPILTALGVGGLAVALALRDTLSNLFSGIHVIASKQVRIGDYIKLESGEEGYVADITWRTTSIRALPNNLIVIPNSKLASAIVINYYLPEKEMSVLVQVGVSYDSDLKKVERVTVEVGKEVMRGVPGGVPEFEPFIRYHTFADFSINFSVILRAKEFTDNFLIQHEFIKRLHQRFKEEGIEIPFPIRTIYMRGKCQA